MKFFSLTDLSTFDSNVFWTLKTMDFENVTFNKSYSYLCNKRHECIIYMMYNQFVVKTYIYITCNVKLGIQNTKKMIISQHRNDKRVMFVVLGRRLLHWCP
jgi:hypothetical protein